MEGTGIASLILIVLNFIVSYKGLTNYGFLDRYCLSAFQVTHGRDYKRLLTCGFLHSSWMHFIFNMIALYSFGSLLENVVGMGQFLLIYFASLFVGNALCTFIHRNNSSYIAVGASGAISGVVFACIALFPDMQMGLLFIPVRISAWIFGLLYAMYCMFGIRAQRDRIGHDNHLIGGMTGLLLTIGIHPHVLEVNYFPILIIAIPSLVFLYLVLTRPTFLLLERPFTDSEGTRTVEDRYHSSRKLKEKELDYLLDKISRHGMKSLTRKEKERLETLSKVK